MDKTVLSRLLEAIDNGSINASQVEEVYRMLYRLFRTPLPPGPILRDNVEVLDKKHLTFYMLMEFAISEVTHAFYVVCKRGEDPAL